MKKLIIIKAGSTFLETKKKLGDFEDWIIDGAGLSCEDVSVINAMANEALPDLDSVAGVIITGSHAMVTDDALWIYGLNNWIPQVLQHNIPLLGICFGHQLLAQAMGGSCGHHPQGREIGTVTINLTSEGKIDRLLGSLPDLFKAHTTHAQTVITLPQKALKLAENQFEAHHAFRLGNNAWGVQFHPEFSADIMTTYINEQAVSLLQNGHDISDLKAAVDNTDSASELLKRFITIVQNNETSNAAV